MHIVKRYNSLFAPCALLFFLTLQTGLAGQASNDAGLGRIGGLGPWEDGTDLPGSLVFSETAGLDKQRTLHLATEAEISWNIWTWLGLQARIPYVYAIGDFGTYHGLGDMELVFTHTLVDHDSLFLKVHVGGRIPSGDADKTLYGRCVPMSYQSSLGTFDFIFGFAFFFKTWSAAAGYQHSFGRNENTFVYDDWIDDDNLNTLVWDYPESPYLARGDDLALRLQKSFLLPSSRFVIGLLPIYRLQHDRITKDGLDKRVDGSMGLTLNIQAGWTINFGKSGIFRLMTVFPAVSKEVSTDGLDRSVMLQAGLGFIFH